MTDEREEHDPRDEAPSLTFDELPLQPTGSGVADLDIAYAQEVLADDHAPTQIVVNVVEGADSLPDEALKGDGADESAAHPS